MACGYDQEGRPIGITAGLDSRICSWDLEKGTRQKRFHAVRPWRLLRHPTDGRTTSLRLLRVAPASSLFAIALSEKGTVRIFDLDRGKLYCAFSAGADFLDVALVAQRLPVAVTATRFGVLRFWSLPLSPRIKKGVARAIKTIDLEVPIDDLFFDSAGFVTLATRNGMTRLRLCIVDGL
jgi:WD40 repeat protein